MPDLGHSAKTSIQILQTTSDEKTPNIKVVDLERLQNFVVHNFFIWNHLGPQIYIFIQTIYRIIQSSNAIEHKD